MTVRDQKILAAARALREAKQTLDDAYIELQDRNHAMTFPRYALPKYNGIPILPSDIAHQRDIYQAAVEATKLARRNLIEAALEPQDGGVIE